MPHDTPRLLGIRHGRRWLAPIRPMIMAVLLTALGLSIAALVSLSEVTVGIPLTVLLLCCVFVGGAVLTQFSKAFALPPFRKGVADSESFLRKQQAALWRLTKSKHIHGGVLEEALREATEAAAHTLEVERASVWLFTDDNAAIRCHDLFERSVNRHSEGMYLNAKEYPAYFRELIVERVIAAADAKQDPRTSEFAAGYLTPLGIASMLGAPIQSGGRMVGVICHEHVGSIHEWTLEEQQFANSMANLVSLALEATERLQAEVALRKSEERIRTIIDTALDAVIGMDGRGRVLDWNRQAETIFGWTREEAIGRDLADTIIPPQFREVHRRGFQHFLKTGEGSVLNKRIEVTGLRRDGSEFPIELAVSPLSTPNGYEFNAFVQDISERKLAEEELRRAKDSAEAANRAKSQFLANMSHEIRTPMNGVLGMIDLMLATTLTSKQRRFAETVRQSGHNLLRIVNEILDFAKVEAGRLALERVDFDVYETIEEVIDLVAERAQAKGLTLACEIDEHVPPMLKGDPGRLRQILINLIGNAIKFTEEGEVVVRVQVEPDSLEKPQSDDDRPSPIERHAAQSIPHPSSQCRLRVSVADTGIGIPYHAQTHIFEPFAQGDGSTTRKYGGTGLGLAIVKQLAEMMNGTVAVQSAAGEGSTFSFTAQFEVSDTVGSPAHVRKYDLDGLRVLIVDGNPTTRTILENQLKAWRMHYGAAESGTEALAFLQYKATRGTPYDLAIIDALLPDMDVLALARAVKAYPELTALRLVMLTAVIRTDEAEPLQQAGIQAILAKPFRQSRLYDCLATVMGGSPEEQAALRRLAPQSEDVQTVAHGRILLAEDNPVNQEVGLGMLEALGCRADMVSNGVEVLRALKQKTYDVILMDCQMPEMDGFEATRQIRELEQQRSAFDIPRSDPELQTSNLEPPRHIPIVAVTAHAITGDRERCLAAGMDDYLSKPFVQAQLHAVLLRWLPQPDAHASRNAPQATAPVVVGRTDAPVLKPMSSTGGSAGNSESLAPSPPGHGNHFTASYGEVPTIDQHSWESIRALQRPGQPDMLCKVIGKFLASSRQLIDTLQLAVLKYDAPAVHRTAHSLKSSSAMLGGLRLAALCKEAEAMGGANMLDGAGPLCEKIVAEYRLVQQALAAELNQVTS